MTPSYPSTSTSAGFHSKIEVMPTSDLAGIRTSGPHFTTAGLGTNSLFFNSLMVTLMLCNVISPLVQSVMAPFPIRKSQPNITCCLRYHTMSISCMIRWPCITASTHTAPGMSRLSPPTVTAICVTGLSCLPWGFFH